MIQFIAHASGTDHPHVGSSEVPTSLFVILGVTAITVLVAVVAARALSKPTEKEAEKQVDKDT
jgi:hypothetical protein